MVQSIKKTKSKKRNDREKQKELYNNIAPRNIIYACIAGLILALLIILFNHYNNIKPDKTNCPCKNATANIETKSSLDDINTEHLKHARANGLKSILNNEEDFISSIDSLIDNGILVEIKSNQYYNIQRQINSYSFLIPECQDLLNLIGKRFQNNLQKQGLPKYKFQINTLLQTRNINLSNKESNMNISAHCYGTTFNLPFNHFDRRGKTYNDEKIEKILEESLIELRKECRLLVLKDNANKCFHITSVLLNN